MICRRLSPRQVTLRVCRKLVGCAAHSRRSRCVLRGAFLAEHQQTHRVAPVAEGVALLSSCSPALEHRSSRRFLLDAPCHEQRQDSRSHSHTTCVRSSRMTAAATRTSAAGAAVTSFIDPHANLTAVSLSPVRSESVLVSPSGHVADTITRRDSSVTAHQPLSIGGSGAGSTQASRKQGSKASGLIVSLILSRARSLRNLNPRPVGAA